MIRALLFDLDNCLVSPREMGVEAVEPAFGAIRRANSGTLSEEKLEAALSDCWRYAFDVVASTHGFSSDMREAGWRAFRNVEVTGTLCGYGDLSYLERVQVQLFLITSGFKRLQASKIRALGIGHLFCEVHIDAIDAAVRIGKREIFSAILARHGVHPTEALVVGDNPDSEIDAGNRLGIPTVQLLRPGVDPSPRAKYRIHSLDELDEIIAAAGSPVCDLTPPMP